MKTRLCLPIAAALVVLATACSQRVSIPVETSETAAPTRIADGFVTSNILREDYAGMDACARCHVQRAAHFGQSAMRNMTRVGTASSIATPFDGSVFEFKGETARLYEEAGERFVELDSERTGKVVYRVTRAIGGRYREDFAGTPVSGDVPEVPPDTEWILPFSYMIDSGTFRYKGYSVPVVERPGLHVSAQWNQTCVFCHNTSPRFSRSWGDVIENAPGYQANFVDRRLPADLQWSHRVEDAAGFNEALLDEIDFLRDTEDSPQRQVHARQVDDRLVAHAIQTSRNELRARHLVDVGIGCESCHHGSAQHAAEPRNVVPTFEPRSDFLSFGPDDGHTPTRAEWINRTCAQCHSVLFSRYPYTWEGGLRRRNPGGSTANSGEARDFILGACSTQMSCVDCHDPHATDDPTALARLRTPQGNGVCVGCHTELAGEQELAAHSRHDPGAEGSACLNCHMPKKNIGLNTNLTAYHRIGTPNDPRRVLNDRPVECGICHAEKSPHDLVDQMEDWWGGSYDRKRLQVLYPRRTTSVAAQTLEYGKPHEQVIALHLLATNPSLVSREEIAALLTHDIPLVRYHAQEALKKLEGVPVDIDLHRDRKAIAEEVRTWLENAEASPGSP